MGGSSGNGSFHFHDPRIVRLLHLLGERSREVGQRGAGAACLVGPRFGGEWRSSPLASTTFSCVERSAGRSLPARVLGLVLPVSLRRIVSTASENSKLPSQSFELLRCASSISRYNTYSQRAVDFVSHGY